MRINKLQVAGLRIAGLAVALAGAGAKDASANDVTVSTSTTTPLVTSAPDNNSPGDVTVASGGSINVGAGQTAVTVNTSNDVTVASGGALTSSDANNTTGILIQGGNAGAVSNSGSINLLETYTIADADNDGDLDGPFAQGTNRHGIFLQAVPAFTGSITNAGLINVEGNSSAGIRLDALLTGDLTSSGTISVAGDGSNGIEINTGAGVSGDVILRNNVAVVGTGANGLVVDGDIGGELRINGTWNVSGFHTNLRPADVSDFDADDLQNGGSAILVRSSVAGGITIEGVGVEDDEDDDGDGETEAENDTDDDATATITVFGSSPAVSIQATPAGDVLLGATASGYGLHVRGSVSAIGVYDNFDATALRIAGDAGGNAVTTAGGVAIDNVVSASAAEANAYAVFIGQNADVPVLQNRRVVTSVVGSEAADTAYGFFFDAGANVPTVTNGGVIRAQMFGEAGDAVVIHDASNSLTTINNTGTIQAQVIATDSDPSDDIPPPAITGSAIAIDVSASSVGVTLNQTPDVPFTDDDATDGDSGGRPAVLIEGDILFGSGADTVNLLAGEIRGDIAFGAGADTFNIDDGAIYSGALTDSGGDLTLNVQDGTLNHAGGALNITSATFGDGSQLGVLISDVPAESTFIESTGAITFAAGSRIVPLVPEGLPASGTQVFLTANGGLIGANNVTGPISGIGTPFVYNLSIDVAAGDPNSLEANFILKSAAELGLNQSQTAGYAAIIDALRRDNVVGDAFADLDTEFEFFDAYEDLMPSYSSAATELAATAIQQMQSATTNRLATTRLNESNQVSIWAQEIAYGLNREPPTANGLEFRGQGFGLAAGIDGPLNNGALFGLSASFLASEAEEPGRPEGEISTWFVQGNAYLGTAVGPFDLDFVGGVGGGKMTSRRFVEVGTFEALSEADWLALEAHGAARVSMPLALTDWFVVTPQAAVTYVGISEQGYTEEGGGAAIDYEVDDAFTQRLWGDVGVEFSARWTMRGGGQIAPRIFAGYRTNLIDEEAERTVRFVSGGPDFTVIDESVGEGGPLLGIGIDATNGYSTLSIGYEGEFGDQIERHSLNAALRFRF